MTLGEKKIPAPTFNDILRPDFESCEVLATYDGNYYNGKPALTKNTVGKGTVYACGSVLRRRPLRRSWSCCRKQSFAL